MQILIFLWGFVVILFPGRELCQQHFPAQEPRGAENSSGSAENGWKYFRNIFIVPCPWGWRWSPEYSLDKLFILLSSPWGWAVFMDLCFSHLGLHGWIFMICGQLFWTKKKPIMNKFLTFKQTFSQRKLLLMQVQGCYFLISTWNKFILNIHYSRLFCLPFALILSTWKRACEKKGNTWEERRQQCKSTCIGWGSLMNQTLLYIFIGRGFVEWGIYLSHLNLHKAEGEFHF